MRKFIVRKDEEGNVAPSKDADPMNYTTRSVFFKKNQGQGNSSEEEEKQDVAINPKTEFESIDSGESERSDEKSESKEIKELFDESFHIIKDFTDTKTKLLQKHLEEEKELTKMLNDTLHGNLLKIAKIDEELEKRKKMLEVEVDEKTKKILATEKLSAMGELSARLAHDIKNPLTMIKNTVKLLRTQEGKPIDEYVLKRFDLVDDSIFRISHQIDGVLDYLKSTPMKMAPASLSGILKSSILPLHIPDGVKVNFPTTDIMLKCDAIKMEIVFGNILLNSIQAVGEKGGQVYVRYAKKPDSVIIEIADSGPGIPQECIDRIFDPLFTTKQKGTGLGLTSSKNIVEQHGGKISAKNTPTTFTIVIPQPQAA